MERKKNEKKSSRDIELRVEKTEIQAKSRPLKATYSVDTTEWWDDPYVEEYNKQVDEHNKKAINLMEILDEKIILKEKRKSVWEVMSGTISKSIDDAIIKEIQLMNDDIVVAQNDSVYKGLICENNNIIKIAKDGDLLNELSKGKENSLKIIEVKNKQPEIVLAKEGDIIKELSK